MHVAAMRSMARSYLGGRFEGSAGGQVMLWDAETLVIEDAIVIARSPGGVWDVLVDDEHFFLLRPDAVDHRDVVPLPTGGHACTQVYEINGRRIEQRSTNRVFERPSLQVDEIETPHGSAVVTISLEAAAKGTRLTLRQETRLNRRLGPFRYISAKLRGQGTLRRSLRTIAEVTTAATSAGS